MPRKSRWQTDHPACAAATREAVDAVRAEKDREIERLHSEIRSLAENLRASATPEALGSDGWYVDMAISTLEKMVREH